MTWLANVDKNTFWAHRSWPEFASLAHTESSLAILPVWGLADHGLGLPLDAEEELGSEVLRKAVVNYRGIGGCWVLPPLRFGLAPYPSCFFGVDPDTAHDLLHEISLGVRAAGVSKLIFFVSGPWNREWVSVASLDIRSQLGLSTYIVSLSGLGFDFHPAGASRAAIVAACSEIIGLPIDPDPRKAATSDVNFRPGNFRQPPPLVQELPNDIARLFATASSRLSALLVEIAAHRRPSPVENSVTRDPEGAQAARGEPVKWNSLFRSRYLPSLTPNQLATLSGNAENFAIIPVGAIEQHGRHLPVGVDAILGQAWLELALSKLPSDAPVWITPPITYGKSNEHASFPGTISVSAKTLRKLVLALASQLKELGFRQVALFNSHGGNSAVLVYVIRELQTTLGLRAGLLNRPYKPELSAQEAEYGFHAGEWETSLMLAATEGLVDMSKAVCEYPARVDDPGELRPENSSAVFSWLTQDISKSGVMGDATLASKEKGARWLEAGSSALATRILELIHAKP